MSITTDTAPRQCPSVLPFISMIRLQDLQMPQCDRAVYVEPRHRRSDDLRLIIPSSQCYLAHVMGITLEFLHLSACERSALEAKARLAGIAQPVMVRFVGRSEVALCDNVCADQIADLVREAQFGKVCRTDPLVALAPHGSLLGHHRLCSIFWQELPNIVQQCSEDGYWIQQSRRVKKRIDELLLLRYLAAEPSSIADALSSSEPADVARWAACRQCSSWDTFSPM